MVIRFETARGLKQDAVDTLTAYLGTLGDPKLEKMLTKAIEKIQKALDSTAWTDDSTVMAKGAKGRSEDLRPGPASPRSTTALFHDSESAIESFELARRLSLCAPAPARS